MTNNVLLTHDATANFISSNLNVSVDEKQEILEINNFKKKANMVMKYLDLAQMEVKN